MLECLDWTEQGELFNSETGEVYTGEAYGEHQSTFQEAQNRGLFWSERQLTSCDAQQLEKYIKFKNELRKADTAVAKLEETAKGLSSRHKVALIITFPDDVMKSRPQFVRESERIWADGDGKLNKVLALIGAGGLPIGVIVVFKEPDGGAVGRPEKLQEFRSSSWVDRCLRDLAIQLATDLCESGSSDDGVDSSDRLRMLRRALRQIDPELGDNEETEEFRCSLLLLASAEYGTDTEVLACITGLPKGYIEDFARRARATGLWVNGQVPCDHWHREGGVLAFVFDLLVLEGELTRKRVDSGEYAYRAAHGKHGPD